MLCGTRKKVLVVVLCKMPAQLSLSLYIEFKAIKTGLETSIELQRVNAIHD